jgi:hypothetical protein
MSVILFFEAGRHQNCDQLGGSGFFLKVHTFMRPSVAQNAVQLA